MKKRKVDDITSSSNGGIFEDLVMRAPHSDVADDYAKDDVEQFLDNNKTEEGSWLEKKEKNKEDKENNCNLT
eukprot:CAMPEP_0184486618 /NCGR_PEP_ID=MMETSP0113_2-20130426/8090_1 /TAXON_ID=91329 /ORGANISM="Norrisiella sphaerica, Strain BC52" /LENGTH=71 /DNA_ID=CAMNT_0026868577 /DNA_START=741 /DNA_END=956 /DNA_ORIENTATION=+